MGQSRMYIVSQFMTFIYENKEGGLRCIVLESNILDRVFRVFGCVRDDMCYLYYI